MLTKKLEYDSSLGGPVVLGTHVPTFKYAASALRELKQLVSATKQTTSTKLIFQSLPKHMRRRAMSHHPKRLPRKYRKAHIHQMSKSGKPQATKRPSRKYRRRPKNLLREYLRRQRQHKWLETHIWHAKRFHMIERWGYKLPYASCDKTYRACYRATTEHCLLQDISFYGCLELRATIEDVKQGFERLTSKECGLSITAKTFITGRREGSIELFKDQQYPHKALGKISFLWRCEEDEHQDGKNMRTVWLWIHPVSYVQILEELITIFNLKNQKTSKVPLEIDEEENPDITTETNSVKLQRRLQFMTKTTVRQSIPCYTNENGSVVLKEFRDTLNRFRLTGPLAQSILQEAFKVKDISNANDSLQKTWIPAALAGKNFENFHLQQKEFWQNSHECITSPGELLSNMVLGLNIEDPRLNRPQKRLKAINHLKSDAFYNPSDILMDIKPLLSSSVLWDEQLRNRISNDMMTTHEYCSLRAEHVIVPGKQCQFENSIQPVPILLIQRPGSQDPAYKRLAYGCGWDIIAPAGYGMSIWLSLIMWGARPGGLREFDSVAREMGTEQHLPDTVGGLQVASERYQELTSKFFKLPTNKRCNYRKFAIVSPFRVPYEQLIRDWSRTTSSNAANTKNDLFILRDRRQLQDIAECIRKCNLSKFPKELTAQCLIQVKLTMKSRGNPKDFSVICLPTKKDFKKNLKQLKYNNNDPIYVEPLLADPNEKERKVSRMQHKKMLKRLRAQRVREKRKRQEISTRKVFIRPAGTAQLCTEQLKKMCKLWLPEDTSYLFSVRKQGTRDCFGYVSTANFCLTEGTVGCIGYVALEGLKEAIKLFQQCHVKEAMCLIRPPNSRNYRFVKFKVNLDV